MKPPPTADPSISRPPQPPKSKKAMCRRKEGRRGLTGHHWNRSLRGQPAEQHRGRHGAEIRPSCNPRSHNGRLLYREIPGPPPRCPARTDATPATSGSDEAGMKTSTMHPRLHGSSPPQPLAARASPPPHRKERVGRRWDVVGKGSPPAAATVSACRPVRERRGVSGPLPDRSTTSAAKIDNIQ
jgi:hypothetical protein